MATPFCGKLHGNGHKISNFLADGKGFCDTGLFGVLGEGSAVDNVVFDKAGVTATGNYVGILAGTSYADISNITITSSVVDCDGEIGGGVVGQALGGSIAGCSFTGNIMSKGSGGGISGYTHSATISSCDVRTNITIDGASAVMSSVVGGGIVGKAFSSEISKCQVAGVISDEIGYACLGGLVGYSFSTVISESFNTAAISAKRASLAVQMAETMIQIPEDS